MMLETDIVVGPFKYSARWRLVLSRYFDNGNVALLVIDPETSEPLLTASVNAGMELSDDEITIKAWSENEGCDVTLIEAGVVEKTDRFAPCGYETATVFKVVGALKEWIERLPSETDFRNAMSEAE